MSPLQYKKKIADSLAKMSATELQQAWLILKEIGAGKKIPVIDNKKELEKKLAKGIEQLDNEEGQDFGEYLHGLNKKYGKG